MAFFVNESCLDQLDRSCIEECPVDCIYEGASKMYINPRECIDCGACEPACPVSAIGHDKTRPTDPHRADNAAFFTELLPGRDAPLGNPGGAHRVGRVPQDTPLVATLVAQEAS
jgi:NAD-dependent dihydropyrimidine dehydrogenase PreA subunit